jgi:hypothetical protein
MPAIGPSPEGWMDRLKIPLPDRKEHRLKIIGP